MWHFYKFIIFLCFGVFGDFGLLNYILAYLFSTVRIESMGQCSIVPIFNCYRHPAAIGQTFLVSDVEDVSTIKLLRRTAGAMGNKAILVPVPAPLMECGSTMLGKRAVAQDMCGSLQVNIQKPRLLLSWNPPQTFNQGLKKAVEGTSS